MKNKTNKQKKNGKAEKILWINHSNKIAVAVMTSVYKPGWLMGIWSKHVWFIEEWGLLYHSYLSHKSL